jgi:putative transposase
MLVMFDVTVPVEGKHAMTKVDRRVELIDLKGLLGSDEDYLRTMVEAIVQATLAAEMTAAVGAEKGTRSAGRLGYRSGYYSRSLITRVGTLELRCRRIARGGSRRSCLSAISARRRRWLRA